MKLYFTLLTVFLFGLNLNAQVSLNVVDFGAVGDGSTVNTAAIQQAIDSCSNTGGGEVILPVGNFKSNTILLKSNVTLRVLGTLTAITGLSNYPEHQYNQPSWSDGYYTKKSLIFAEDAHHIRITGGGSIKCSGQDFGVLSESNKNLRPFGLRIHKCTDVTIDSIRLENAPQWMLHMFACDTVVIRAVSVYNQGFGSNDGMDIDCCRHVLIEDCDLDTNDDPIAIKTHCLDTCRDVMVRRCTIATFERGAKVGNESEGPLRNIHFEDITIKASTFPIPALPQTAIYLAITDGGSADSIWFERIHVTTPFQTPIFIRLNDRGESYTSVHPPVQYLRNVWIRDVECTAGSTIPCSVTAMPGYYVENISLKDISITLPGGGPSAIVPVPELEGTRPENDMWGDILPAYGIYVRHAKNFIADSVCFTLQAADPRAEYWFEDTAGVTIVNQCVQTTAVENIPLAHSGKVYPNPAADVLMMDMVDNETIKRLSLFDVSGKFYPVETWWNVSNGRIQLTGLSAGVYWLQSENENGEKKMFRFVKQ